MIAYSILSVQKIIFDDLTESGMVVEDEVENPEVCE